MTRIGVLALQGDFREHLLLLESLGVAAVPVKTPAQLAEVDALVIPGGESTTIGKMATRFGLIEPLRESIDEGLPTYGTCAGLILLASEVENPRQPSLGFIDVTVERNAYGRQRESFEEHGEAMLDGRPSPIEMVFIRAPRIRRVGEGVTTLARHGDEAVMARQGTILVATFHPELTDDPTIHRYFCRMVEASRRG